jgi:hypothetical protein
MLTAGSASDGYFDHFDWINLRNIWKCFSAVILSLRCDDINSGVLLNMYYFYTSFHRAFGRTFLTADLGIRNHDFVPETSGSATSINQCFDVLKSHPAGGVLLITISELWSRDDKAGTGVGGQFCISCLIGQKASHTTPSPIFMWLTKYNVDRSVARVNF